MNSDSFAKLDTQYPDFFDASALSIALIGPDGPRRNAVAAILADCHGGGEVKEFPSYPPSLDDVPRMLEQQYSVILIDLDSDREYALELVESICANGVSTVMVYSEKDDPELMLRCMRSGVREFLTLPLTQSTMAEALVRASARRPAKTQKKTGSKLLIFFGAKGGSGVTMIASNFAVALAQDTEHSTLFIDFDLPLGDAALNLGLEAEYSTISALQESHRLDSAFLSKLLVKHSSGLSVLAAPGKFPQYAASNEAIEKLLSVARQDFDNVVVDVGSRLDMTSTPLFKDASTIYLVTQAGIPELRNSNRLINQFFSRGGPALEIVINRHSPRSMGVGDEHIAKALNRTAQWLIPNDWAAVRQMQNSATPLVLEDSPISRPIKEMASAITGQPVPPEKKKGFSFRTLGRSTPAKSSNNDAPLSITPSPSAPADTGNTNGAKRHTARTSRFEQITQEQKTPEQNSAEQNTPEQNTPEQNTAEQNTQEQKSQEETPYTPAKRTLLPAEPPAFSAAPEPTVISKRLHEEPMPAVTAPVQQSQPETRTYKGMTYVKGADGKWHQQTNEPPRMAQLAPDIEWMTLDPVSYGTALSAAQLNASSSVEGKFVYAPAAGYVLAAGTHTIWVIFTPTDTARYTTAQAAASLLVTKSTPAIKWPKLSAIARGARLGPAQLNAIASVPGTFEYSPAAGEVLPSGLQTLSVTFTPTDTANYNPTEASTSLLVTRGTPSIEWPAPDPIPYGTPLGSAQLNATSSVPGTFVYIPAEGAVLAAGTHRPSLIFTPTDAENYLSARAAVSLIVTKAEPFISWPSPDPIPYGTALTNAQLNATSSVPGTFVYSPAEGEILEAGLQTLSVTFTPTDTADYTKLQVTVDLTVTKAEPTVIAWPEPADIPFGAALSEEQLNATAPIAGTFVYSPAVGEMLSAGTHSLSATFTPADPNFPETVVTVPVTVTKATPIIKWATPAVICHGTPLSMAELNATASVPGTFDFLPTAGEVLAAGTQTLLAIFTPTDSVNYTTAEGTVTLIVTKVSPDITWSAPNSIPYGTALSHEQLNAKASVPGKFSYTPAAGTVLADGTHTLSVTFTPDDIADYTIVQAAVSLVVEGLPDFASLAPGGGMGTSAETRSRRPHDYFNNLDTREGGMQGSHNFNQDEPETRTYKGATYVKGLDGKWHQQQK
jgi:Flp pilus assembly CpaE family ATPase